ncbi:MAG: hypothetical protein ACOYMV_05220 [Verrucomicrobiia bacterium]
MKNITVSVDDEVYRRARIRAAERSSSVSALVKAMLLQMTEQGGETEFERLQREEQTLRESLRANGRGLNPAHHLTREELHDRHALR